MTTIRPFVRGVSRSFALFGERAEVRTRTRIDLRTDGLRRDVEAIRRDAETVGADLRKALQAAEA